MKKEKKNGSKNLEALTKRIVFAAAILNPIKAAFDLFGRLLE